MPIAVRRQALSASVQGWRIRTAQAAAVDVYASCSVGKTPLAATFADVMVTPASELTLDLTVPRRWRLLEDGVRPVAEATPRLPGEADGPNAPKECPLKHPMPLKPPQRRTARRPGDRHRRRTVDQSQPVEAST
jgi:hypothetical protein